MEEKFLKEEIIRLGKKLYDLRLAVARGGNLSSRLAQDTILITATSVSLGELREEDIITVDLTNSADCTNKSLSTEFPLHSLIYKNFSKINRVIHCHPPLTNAYFSVYDDLEILTFETKLFLGQIPAVKQFTPSVTNPKEVIDALKMNNLVAMKNHGVVSMGENFTEAFYLIESLEEAVRMAGVARLFKKETLNPFEEELKKDLSPSSAVFYEMFSLPHMEAIVDLVNNDESFRKLGAEFDLSVDLAIMLASEAGKAYTFHFVKGKIDGLDEAGEAPFVISASREIWQQIFFGKLDPFVATTQKKMELKGELTKLTRWYLPFTRLFALFKEVKIQ
ncbi:MAG: class II aldolase/adducin family protein [Thermodesulfobacteriota bacterium]|jgi:L-fuculose-phosphate aldolase|nr:MAG: class II aldolase/adducin family protein [Thermodesulfobacteriota bacterium]